jgi:hypothetical protein
MNINQVWLVHLSRRINRVGLPPLYSQLFLHVEAENREQALSLATLGLSGWFAVTCIEDERHLDV